MNTTITFRNLPSSDALRDHAKEKAAKLNKYLIKPVDIHIVLSVEKIRQTAEITVHAKDYRAHAIETSMDMYTSIDKSISKVESQIRRHKERVKNHKIESKAFQVIENTVPMMD